jgi:hypothetical protein
MDIEGGCYCGALRYKASGDPIFQGQCHCRECQYISGGSPNMVLGMPGDGFSYTKGAAKQFQRGDLESPVTREFCGECGTHILSIAPALGGARLLKVGTLDDPKQYAGPQMAIYLCDKQSFHSVPEGVPTFDTMPGG